MARLPGARQIARMTPSEIDETATRLEAQVAELASEHGRTEQIFGQTTGVAAAWGASDFQMQLLQGSPRDQARKIEEIRACIDELDAEHDRRGGWTRVFLTAADDPALAHATLGCPAAAGREHVRLPEWSGRPFAEIAEAAGARACPTCFPDVPFHWRARATRILSPAERSRWQGAGLAPAAATASPALAFADVQGQPVHTPEGQVLRTVDAAVDEYARHAAEIRWYEANGRGSAPGLEVDRAVCVYLLESIAAHRGTTTEAQEIALERHVEARLRRDWG